MPKTMQNRTPHRVYEALVDGYNIDTMYAKTLDYLEEEGEG